MSYDKDCKHISKSYLEDYLGNKYWARCNNCKIIWSVAQVSGTQLKDTVPKTPNEESK